MLIVGCDEDAGPDCLDDLELATRLAIDNNELSHNWNELRDQRFSGLYEAVSFLSFEGDLPGYREAADEAYRNALFAQLQCLEQR